MSKLSLKDTIENPKYSKLPRKFFVEFAYSCVNETRPLIKEFNVIKALDLVALWLEDKATDEEVIDAHGNTYLGAYNVVGSICSIISFSIGPCYARLSAYHAAWALNIRNPEIKEQEYAQRFLDKVNGLTKVEKVLYGIE